MNPRPRARTALQHWELRFGPNMTPMVDIVMVILVFFMAGTALVGPEWVLRSALPHLHPAATPAPDPFRLPPARFVIRLQIAQGITTASGLGLTDAPLDRIEAALAELAASTPGAELAVLIHPHPDVPYRDVIRLHDACDRAAIHAVGILP